MIVAVAPAGPHNHPVRTSTPWWALLSSACAPVLLIGGWTAAGRLQSGGFDGTTETISALAAVTADERWLMTTALAGLGLCHLVTAAGLTAAAPAGRCTLAAGGAATMLVAAFPLPASGSSTAHAAAATAAFLALALWPAVAWRRAAPTPPALRPAVSVGAAALLLGLVGWFAASLATGAATGLAERVAAGAQAGWPLIAVLSARAAAPPPPRQRQRAW